MQRHGITSGLAALVAGLLVGCAAPAAQIPVPGPSNAVVSQRSVHYDVAGSTRAELLAALDELGPLREGKRSHAYTDWDIRWLWDFAEGVGRCGLRGVEIRLAVVITMPRWNEVGASGALRSEWRRYTTALLEHEEGHATFGEAAAAAIDRALSKLGSFPTCDEADLRANAIARDILDRFVRDEIEYDRDTDHGATQGARLRRL